MAAAPPRSEMNSRRRMSNMGLPRRCRRRSYQPATAMAQSVCRISSPPMERSAGPGRDLNRSESRRGKLATPEVNYLSLPQLPLLHTVLSHWQRNLWTATRGKTREMCYLRDGVWLWSRFWRAAVAVCVVFAAAGNSSRSSHDGVDDEIGFAKRAKAELAISDEQRGRIYDSVMRISDAPIAGGPAPEVADSLLRAINS